MDIPFILISVSLIWMIAVITPGPNFFITLQTAISKTRRSALIVAVGICTGTVIWGITGFFGISVLFSASPLAYLGLKLIGGGYLIYLGVRLFISEADEDSTGQDLHPKDMEPFQAFRRGIITNLSNPKATAFVAGLFAATMPPDAPAWLGLLTTAIMVTISFAWYAAVAFLFSLDRFKAVYNRSITRINRISGAIFTGFGLKLAAD